MPAASVCWATKISVVTSNPMTSWLRSSNPHSAASVQLKISAHTWPRLSRSAREMQNTSVSTVTNAAARATPSPRWLVSSNAPAAARAGTSSGKSSDGWDRTGGQAGRHSTGARSPATHSSSDAAITESAVHSPWSGFERPSGGPSRSHASPAAISTNSEAAGT